MNDFFPFLSLLLIIIFSFFIIFFIVFSFKRISRYNRMRRNIFKISCSHIHVCYSAAFSMLFLETLKESRPLQPPGLARREPTPMTHFIASVKYEQSKGLHLLSISK